MKMVTVSRFKKITLKPSIMIQHIVKTRGGIFYKIDERASESIGDKGERAEWKTERTIDDMAAYNAARAVRAKIETLLRSKTGAARADIGLIATDDPETWKKIDDAEAEIVELIDGYMAEHPTTTTAVTSLIVTYKIGSKDERQLQAIADSVADSMDTLKEAVKAADYRAIRGALKDLKGLDKLMPDAEAAALQKMMETLKAKARSISKAVNKEGKKLDELKDEADAAPINEAEIVLFGADEADAEPESPTAAAPAVEAADVETETPESPAEEPAPLPTVDLADFALDGESGGEEVAPAPAPVAAADVQTDDTGAVKDKRGEDWKDGEEPAPAPTPAP